VNVDRLFAQHLGLQHFVEGFDLAPGIRKLLLLLFGLILLLRIIYIFSVFLIILIFILASHVVSVVDLLLLLENLIHLLVVEPTEQALVVRAAEYAASRLELFLPIGFSPISSLTKA